MQWRVGPVRMYRALSLVIATVAIGGCLPGGGSEPNAVEAVPALNESLRVQRVVVKPSAVWGSGRALRASVTSTGALTVVTTTGVFRVDDPDSDAVLLDTFDAPVQPGATALSADQTTFALTTASPPEIRTYDVVSGSRLARLPLPAGATPRQILFGTPTNDLITELGDGPYRTTDPAIAPTPVLDVPTTGHFGTLPDGTLVIPLAGTSELAIHRGGTTERRALAIAPEETVFDVHASADGSAVAVSVGDGQNRFDRQDRVVVLDATTFEVHGIIDVGEALEPLQWTVVRDAVVISDGPKLEGWTLKGAPLGQAASVDSSIEGLYEIPGGVLTAHSDGALTRWATGTLSPTVIDAGGAPLEHVTTSAISPLATTVDRVGRVTSWNISEGTRVATEERFAVGEATSVAISSDARMVAASSSSGRVTLLNPELTDDRTLPISDVPALIGAVAFEPTSGALATGIAQRTGESAFNDQVTVWNDTQQQRFSFGGESESVAGCSFFFSRVRYSPDGRTLAVTSHDFSVFVLDAASGKVLHELPGVTTVLDVAFSPDGSRLVATYDNATVAVWDTSEYTQIASLTAAQGGYFAIAVRPGSTSMVVTDITGAMSVIDLASGDVIGQFANDATFSTATLAISADGAILAAPTDDGGIGFWSIWSGERLATTVGHTGEVIGLAFSPAGDWVASASTDGTVRTWTIEVT